MKRTVLGSVFALVAAVAVAAQQGPGLRIVVLAGEDAVNIIQQKTAVPPLVEVRDRNDLPVVGAVVRFSIDGGKAAAFAGGAPTLTVSTNAAGQAVATGLRPLVSGALQIQMQAEFQGLVAQAAITQTNVMTAAQAAALGATAAETGGATGGGTGGAAGGTSGASGGTSGAAGAGGAAGGGGLSATTIGIIGGAVGGGVFAARQFLGEGPTQRYSGPFAFDWVVGCLVERMSGTLTVEFEGSSDAPETPVSAGKLSLQNGTGTVVSRPPGCGVLGSSAWGMNDAPVTGTLSSLESRSQDTVQSLIAGATMNRSFDFRGGLSGGSITGTFGMAWQLSIPGPASQSSGSGSVTLTRVQ
ncbi:MAG: hypothetical protein ACT4QD_07110 [Acidobacteriota bacterium]